MRKLEQGNQDKLQGRAKEIVALAIQKYPVAQTQELTTMVILTTGDLKGRIIGKSRIQKPPLGGFWFHSYLKKSSFFVSINQIVRLFHFIWSIDINNFKFTRGGFI
jgi:hypothetical protein